MGATNPADATDGTLRKLFAESIEANSVHGCDSDDNAVLKVSGSSHEGNVVSLC